MAIKLIAIPKKSKKEKYEVVLECVHGDADKYENITITCKDQRDLEKKLRASETQPLDGSAGGDEDEYVKWLDDNFGIDNIPWDCVFISSGNHAKVTRVEGYYYDANGTKWKAEIDN